MHMDKCCFFFDQESGVQILGIILVGLSAAGVIAGAVLIHQIFIIASFISMCINILLIVYSKWKFALLGWLMMTPPVIIVVVVLGIYLFLVKEVESFHLYSPDCQILGGFCFAFAVLLCYFWMVVYSLYRRLTDLNLENEAEEATTTEVTAEPTFGKGPPPNYTDIMMDPPPPLYDQVLNVCMAYKKETETKQK